MGRSLLCGLIATLSIAVAPPRSGAAPAKVRILWELNGTADLACLAAADLTGKDETEVLACDQTGTLHVIGLNGQEKRTFSLGQNVNRFDVGDLTGDGAREIVATRTWGREVEAFDAQGTSLWKYSVDQGVDSIATQDFDGDGQAETAVGFNGSTGLHLLSSTGQPRWVYGEIGNVWNVAASRVMGDDKWYVLATDGGNGTVKIVDAAGRLAAQLKPGPYLAHVDAADLNQDGTDEIIAVGIDLPRSQQLVVCMDQTGAVKWQVPIGPKDHNASRQCLATGDFNGDGTDDVIVLGTKGMFYLIDGSGAVRVQQAVSVALNGVCALPKNDQGKQAFVIGGGQWWCCCEEE